MLSPRQVAPSHSCRRKPPAPRRCVDEIGGATVTFIVARDSHDLQALGDFLRIAPEGVIDETVEQVWWQQARARPGLDRAAPGVQPGRAGTFVEFGDVVIDVVEVVLE